MQSARRLVIRGEQVVRVLAHPVRLDVLNHLMAHGPATASACARAVGDTPSNCSYHLRTLAKVGLVVAGDSTDGRERPWRATITGFSFDDDNQPNPDDVDARSVDDDRDAPNRTDQRPADPRSVAAVAAAALQLDQRAARTYLARRAEMPPRWRQADAFARYGLAVTAAELEDIVERVDAVVRPFLAATRDNAPADAEAVRFAFQAFAPAPSRPRRPRG